MSLLYRLLFLFGAFLLWPSSTFAAPIVTGSFSTTWSTNDSTQVQINLGVCPDEVYWESLADEEINDVSFSCDGSFDTVVDFGGGGEYRVDFSGSFTHIDLGIQNNKDKFRTVEQWGASTWTDLNYAFANVTELAITASDVPDLSSITRLEGMFKGATNFNSAINNWDVSSVTDMGDMGEGCNSGLFMNATSFNQPLDSWDVSNVTDFACLFKGATAFNQPLASWNTASGINTMNMFENATSFNQPLNNWSTHNFVNIYGMFRNATSFNQPLNNWDTTSVTGLTGMFTDATSFNQDLSTWDFSGVTYFSAMFSGATAFNQSLENWSFNDEDIITDMLAGSGISSHNYALTLEWWASLNLMPDTNFGREDIGSIPVTYCATAQAARDMLTTNGWIIADGGPVTCYTAAYTAGVNGSVTGDTTQYVAAGHNGTSVRAVPNAGYYFDSWSDGVTTNPRTDNNLTGGLEVYAIFSAVERGGDTTKVGIRAKRLIEAVKTLPAVGSLTMFVTAVRDLITYLTVHEDELDALTAEERTKLIIGLRDILLFLLQRIPGF